MKEKKKDIESLREWKKRESNERTGVNISKSDFERNRNVYHSLCCFFVYFRKDIYIGKDDKVMNEGKSLILYVQRQKKKKKKKSLTGNVSICFPLRFCCRCHLKSMIFPDCSCYSFVVVLWIYKHLIVWAKNKTKREHFDLRGYSNDNRHPILCAWIEATQSVRMNVFFR